MSYLTLFFLENSQRNFFEEIEYKKYEIFSDKSLSRFHPISELFNGKLQDYFESIIEIAKVLFSQFEVKHFIKRLFWEI